MVYPGSKNRIHKDILRKMIPFMSKERMYYEPFVGGANMIDKISTSLVKGRVGNDINKYLIALLNYMKTDNEIKYEFIEKEDWYENYLYPFKRGELDLPDNEIGYLGFTKTFSGYFMHSYAGGFKTGNNRDFQKAFHNNIAKQSGKPDWLKDYIKEVDENIIEIKESKRENFKEIEFISGSYLDMEIEDNSAVYVDPPYRDTTGYNAGKHGKKEALDYDVLYDWLENLVKVKNCAVFISEYNMPEDRFEYIWKKQINGGLAKGSAKSKPVEKLFVVKGEYDG